MHADMDKDTPGPIDDPLWDLMLCTHGCTPECGCEADFSIEPDAIGGWIDDFGEEFARFALKQLDSLIARGREIQDAVAQQRCRRFRAPETVTEWLLRWRPAIETALHDFLTEEVPTMADAEATCNAARDAVHAKRRWLSEREQLSTEAFRRDPQWISASKAWTRAFRRLQKARRARDPAAEAGSQAELDSARALMAPIEDAARSQDPEHAIAKHRLRDAELAELEARRKLGRTIARARAADPAPALPTPGAARAPKAV
jgi:hypothetical protein